MAKYSEIPGDIARKIAGEHLNSIEDFEAFRKVCVGWRSATKGVLYQPSSSKTQLPWLMVADSKTRLYSLTTRAGMYFQLNTDEDDDDDDNENYGEESYLRYTSKGFLIFANNNNRNVTIIDPRLGGGKGKVRSLPVGDKNLVKVDDWYKPYRYYSSKGCIIRVSNKSLNVKVLDPMSGYVIRPPTIPYQSMGVNNSADDWYKLFVGKFALSKRIYDGGDREEEDYAIAMISDYFRSTLSLWKPGRSNWSVIKTLSSLKAGFEDVCFFRGKVYAVDGLGQILVFDTASSGLRVVAVFSLSTMMVLCSAWYLVEADAKLLVVQRAICKDDNPSIGTTNQFQTYWFKVYEVNVENGKITRLHHLDDKAIFVGSNSSFIVDASNNKQSCQSNSIYFTDNLPTSLFIRLQGAAIGDFGIYSLTEKKMIQQSYNPHVHVPVPSHLFNHLNSPTWLEFSQYPSTAKDRGGSENIASAAR